MPRISHILAVPAAGSYYNEDLVALQARPLPLAERYTTPPVTSGFNAVREVAEALSIGLVLDDQQIVWGDAVSVAYGGKAGRDQVFRALEGQAAVERTVLPALRGRRVDSFRSLAAEMDGLVDAVEEVRPVPGPGASPNLSRRDLFSRPFRARQAVGPVAERPTERIRIERPLHSALRYGISQALLQAAACVRGRTMAEVIAEEWDLPLPRQPIPIHAQSGGDRYDSVDKMLARRVASLPHGLIDNLPEQLGADGSALVQYARWLKKKIDDVGDSQYRPTIHLDVHGALGRIAENKAGRVLGHLYALASALNPYALRIESPLILESRGEQIEAFKTLREYIRARKINVQLVADEWANTLDDIQAFLAAQAVDMIQIKMPDLGSVHNSIDAVLACKAAGTGAFLGGSCCETDLSARVSVHCALATQPALMMAKPGMGVDEGITLVQNEMARTLAWIRYRAEGQDAGTVSNEG